MTTGHPFLRRRVRPTPPGQEARPTSVAPATTVLPPPTGAPAGTGVTGTGATGSSGASTGGGGLSLSFGRPAPAASPGTATPSGTGTTATAGPPSGNGPALRGGSGSGSAPVAGAGPSDRVARRLALRASRIRPFPAPDPRDVRVLDAETPVVRLDRRRSAVGALRVTGSTSAAWESVDRVVGARTVDGATAGRSVTTPGNRPLVGYDDRDVLVALRHVRDLRRALVMGRGAERLVVALHDGTTLAVDPGDADTTVVLALSVVDGEVELRAEPFPRASHDGDVFAAFGFVLSAPTVGV
ncbi:hypothetical protein [Curtobacterium sp. MCSS17_015]|uniref:hypothetical protein n=1 Tax=Curtobacterium sp. MCSS17_015 TaxID=2175666 RepID=UPI000DA873F2|nr:hypothetical protein [Curtobacterium sp. MCSS17_015]WIB25013.1 hypothetical protein DEJ18_07900 [Curtobacterium sp. MCSS17_015]